MAFGCNGISGGRGRGVDEEWIEPSPLMTRGVGEEGG